jgi:uncharacterized membrane protein
VSGATSPGRREEAAVPPRYRGLISRLLRGGLLVALALVVVGIAGYALDGVGVGVSGTSARPTAVGLAPGAFVLAGLAVLIATPLARVGASVGLFAAAGDRDFVALTLFVLAVLAVTVLVGVLR